MPDGPTITFDASAAQTVLEAFDWTINQNGFIVDGDRPHTPVAATDGNTIHIEDFAGVITDPDTGNPVPVRSNFVSKIDAIKATQ